MLKTRSRTQPIIAYKNYRENGGENNYFPRNRVNYMDRLALPGHRELDRSRACSHSGVATLLS
uniref:Uncharacterized protein n=1 Tax=Setaria italica TaxID=4555 RepID=K4AK52_SETIT